MITTRLAPFPTVQLAVIPVAVMPLNVMLVAWIVGATVPKVGANATPRNALLVDELIVAIVVGVPVIVAL
jgi:hypothetical protein